MKMQNIVDKVFIVSFTQNGSLVAQNISCLFEDKSIENLKCFGEEHERLCDFVERVFNVDEKRLLVFIGAVGIAVRSIAKFIDKKTKDPAVIVIDEQKKFCIPILSGHIGRANDFALFISRKINSMPVITTATDLNGLFAIDSWCERNGFSIINPSFIKNISSFILNKKSIYIYSNKKFDIPFENVFFTEDFFEANVILKNDSDKKTALLLNPIYENEFVIGIGCKKNTLPQKLVQFVQNILQEYSIDSKSIKMISSIDIKKDEKAILSLSSIFDVCFRFFSKEELLNVEGEFTESDFVKKTVGVGNVCERSVVACGGIVVIGKIAFDGMTISIGQIKKPRQN